MLPLLLFSACAWDPPLDPEAPAVRNVLSGEVLVTGTDTVAPTFVLLFDAAAPPPPEGTGSPLTFAAVPAEAYTGGGAGVQAGRFALTGVPDGTWLLTALMDMDGDFQPLLSSHAGATCGDWVGAHLADLSTGEPAPVTVGGGVELDDVVVTVGVEMTTERPAFALTAPSLVQTSTDPQLFRVDSIGVASSVLTLAAPGTDPCGTSFLFYAPDADGDGAPDPHPEPAFAAAGLYDLWPKVYLRYLGAELEPGESWTAEAVVYPGPLVDGTAPVGVPTPVTALDVVWVPAARHTFPDGSAATVAAPNLPGGAWSVTVVSLTGQTWTVPNELASFPAADASFDPSTQAATLLVE